MKETDLMSKGFQTVERSPTVKEYQRLRKAVGWENVSDESAEIGLRNSLFSVCAVYRDEVVGYGRVIGSS